MKLIRPFSTVSKMGDSIKIIIRFNPFLFKKEQKY
jgi:hypothetical protein